MIFFFFFYVKEISIVDFITLSSLNVLYDSDTIFVDGTLGSFPKSYQQLFTVYCTVNQFYVSPVYILLLRRLYNAIYSHFNI